MPNVISNEMDVSAKYQMTVLLNISRYQITAAKNISSTCIKKSYVSCYFVYWRTYVSYIVMKNRDVEDDFFFISTTRTSTSR